MKIEQLLFLTRSPLALFSEKSALCPHICRLDPGPLASAQEWLGFYERFWTERLNVLDSLLQQADAPPFPPEGTDP